ncbi:hypothetical protein L2E82_01024 [Cichorium intybus]|uniref:Uncharacterized protein n=1 Tax=Cichorium intybus TaxID=13427 RepID=A0ACB9GXR6_CICIN|nr:hypothetical protein L2E82_01024 [Cichorium intybus]
MGDEPIIPSTPQHNDLTSLAKAIYLPYDIDFNRGPTHKMLYGVNFASAAAGILDITGRNFPKAPNHISLFRYFSSIHLR